MAQRWDAMAALVDGGRRALFEHVRQAGHPVSREEAADACGISRGLAAFHLDKLVEAGLLRARYQAAPDVPRGRGRTPKVYEAVGEDLAVSVPEREYALAAAILADALADLSTHGDSPHEAPVGDPDDPPVDSVLTVAACRHARRHGRALGADLRDDDIDLVGALRRTGYHPCREGDHIALTNCPFHAIAQRHTELMCGLNLEFIGGLIDTLAPGGHQARLAPAPGRCCVEITCPDADDDAAADGA